MSKSIAEKLLDKIALVFDGLTVASVPYIGISAQFADDQFSQHVTKVYAVSSIFSTSDQSTSRIMKGRAFEPSHPVSITIRPIPHVHSNADQHTKHNKQQRREEVTMFFLESFEVPTQNLYTSIWYGFYVNDLSSTQHTPYHQYKILESPIHSQFFMRSQFLIRSKSIPVKQDPLSLKGHQQSPSPAVSIYHEQQQQIGTRSFLVEVNNSHIQVQLQFKFSPRSGTPPEQTRYFCQYWFHPHKLKCAFIKNLDSFESQISSSEFSFSQVAVISRE